MVYTLLSWIVIGVCALIWGIAVLYLLSKFNHYFRMKLDFVLMTGVCALTVYAQLFSLFWRVSRAALLFVFLVDIILLLVLRKKVCSYIRSLKKDFILYKLLVILCIGVMTLVIASKEVSHYDTYLYHAQAIHWIEEYGVVPGLGNLHYRLAYNSSFLCLQALFSFRIWAGQSLHSVNGFIMWIMLSYSVCAMKFWKDKKFFSSDFLRLVIILHYVKNIQTVSSPETDMFTLGLVVYILSKWVSLLEDNETDIAPYAYLCILGVYSMTLKLSAAMIVFLAIKPIYQLFTGKRWKEIAFYGGLGIWILFPFLVRNVIISGYLLYPYPELDLFSVDWKMSKIQLIKDRNEIKTWAWGINDSSKAGISFGEWFPVWREKIGEAMYALFIVDVILMPVSLGLGVIYRIRKRKWDFLHISSCIISCILFWFIFAPLIRYGRVYLFLLPMYLIGKGLEVIKDENIVVVLMVMLITYFITPLISSGTNIQQAYWIKCGDYSLKECYSVDVGNLQIYLPATGDVTGYHYFPSTHSPKALETIEPRGESFAEGFRTVSQ